MVLEMMQRPAAIGLVRGYHLASAASSWITTEAQRAQRLTEEKRSIVSVLCGCSLCPLCLCGESDARGFLPHDRDLDARRVPGRVPDAMSLGPKIRRLRSEDVGDPGLRVAVVQREPGALDLHHDLVTPLERIGLL